jgi:hypothetical protein
LSNTRVLGPYQRDRLSKATPQLPAVEDDLLIVQCLMYEEDRDGALAHRRRHTLDIPCPDVTHRENSGQTRFKKMGSPGEGPLRGG